jgi:hypothetical protein
LAVRDAEPRDLFVDLAEDGLVFRPPPYLGHRANLRPGSLSVEPEAPLGWTVPTGPTVEQGEVGFDFERFAGVWEVEPV